MAANFSGLELLATAVVVLDERTVVRRNADVEHERKVAIFDLLDANWGDLVPCIDAGWDLKLLPVFIKRKPVYNYLWVRSDRGIDSPRDLEGKVIATGGYGSAITMTGLFALITAALLAFSVTETVGRRGT